MALPTPYISVAEADVLLENVEPWSSATDEEKQEALEMGRLYLDDKYVCIDFDESNPPTNVKDANGYLGNCHLEGSLFPSAAESTGSFIKLKRVKAGSVETETEYSDIRGSKSVQTADPCPIATALLRINDTCRLTTTGGTVSLVRR